MGNTSSELDKCVSKVTKCKAGSDELHIALEPLHTMLNGVQDPKTYTTLKLSEKTVNLMFDHLAACLKASKFGEAQLVLSIMALLARANRDFYFYASRRPAAPIADSLECSESTVVLAALRLVGELVHCRIDTSQIRDFKIELEEAVSVPLFSSQK